jgi:hypothetical protein
MHPAPTKGSLYRQERRSPGFPGVIANSPGYGNKGSARLIQAQAKVGVVATESERKFFAETADLIERVSSNQQIACRGPKQLASLCRRTERREEAAGPTQFRSGDQMIFITEDEVEISLKKAGGSLTI